MLPSRIREVPMQSAARLLPKGDHLIIEVNASHVLSRRRFSIAHDISHTLLPTYTNVAVEDRETGRFAEDNEEELLCDCGAAALLLDPRWLRPRAHMLPPSLEALIQLASDFGASLHATAIQLAALAEWHCAFVFWEEGYSRGERVPEGSLLLPGLESHGAPRPKLRAAARYPAKFAGCYIPRNKSAADGSLIVRCREADTSLWGVETFDFGNRQVQLLCESLYAPYRVGNVIQPRVISLLLPVDRAESPPVAIAEQMEFF